MRRHFLTLLLVVSALPSVLSAAAITFEPQEYTVGTDSPFVVGVDLDARDPVSVIALSLVFSPGLEPVDVSDGNSIVSMWIDRPVFDQRTRTLSFSGMVPGGYSGTKGRVLTLRVAALREGIGTISVGRQSRAYRNGPDGIEDVLDSQPLSLSVSPTRQNLANTIPDSNPPEEFTPQIVTLPNGSGTQRHAIAFAAQDKGSGIDHYEVSESRPILSFTMQLFGMSLWHEATSPYKLADQGLHSTISIRAIDKNGNIRNEIIDAPEGVLWLPPYIRYALAVGAGILSIVLAYRKIRSALHI